MSAKSDKIKETLKATKLRRQTQVCRVYEAKVDKSKLSDATKTQLNKLFLQAKWFYNAVLSSESLFDFDTKSKSVQVKVDTIFEERELDTLSSQVKQSLIDRMSSATRTLKTLKTKGKKVGKLKFKSYINSIPLKQFDNTYKFIDNHHVRIQNIKEPLYVHGLDQVKNSDIANANLIRNGDDYYLKITTYKEKPIDTLKEYSSVGIDFNIEAGCQLVLDNGIAFGFNVETHKDEQLKNYQRKLARINRTNKKLKKNKHSKNRLKTILKIQRCHRKHKNKKNEIRNQIVSVLKKNFNKICHQKESINGWQRMWGKRIQGTALAGIIARLDTSSTTNVIGKFIPTTKTCNVCGYKNKDLTLDIKWWTCPECNTRHNRHINAAINMLPRSERASTSVESSSSAKSLLALESKFKAIGVIVRLLSETDNSGTYPGSPRL